MHKIDFTYDSLRALLEHGRTIAPITTMRARRSDGCIVLRHDVDFDICQAYELSKIEKKMDVTSTFFIMTTCPTYNPRAKENRKMIKEMAADGFEIGLHFDPTVYGDVDMTVLKKHVDAEAAVLENITGWKITSISLHNPSVTGMYPIFEGYDNAYSKEIFSDDLYISDSCKNFRGKDPFSFLEKAREHTVQMVLHPIHWSNDGASYPEAFSRYFARNAESIDHYFQVNPTYILDLGGVKLWDEIRRK